MEIVIPVPIGDVVDKLTILEIKNERISDPVRLAYIQQEMMLLNDVLNRSGIAIDSTYFSRLKQTNEKIWETEEVLRKDDVSVEDFVRHARNNAKFNDERFVIKNAINKAYNSTVQEQKAHNALYSDSNRTVD
jgi:hypothetical protein